MKIVLAKMLMVMGAMVSLIFVSCGQVVDTEIETVEVEDAPAIVETIIEDIPEESPIYQDPMPFELIPFKSIPQDEEFEPVTPPLRFDEEDIIAVAKMVYGEAGACELDDKTNCIITVCNRVDDSRWPDTPYEVVTQYYQYLGYRESNPVTDEHYALAVDVLTRWSLGEEFPDYNSFWGDGIRNHFYTV